ncbi:uncharacterized protein LOC123566429 [Mercenaria mercenaria]|uniref:uncharacterized protein LOC123566429 n=1 Tax=Mercenaria mercenaria TaxID=6596 RepID=UPI00234E9A12|nr:uncharacterized protein LOC123566429 [Mercenaria mercenaria]
MGGQQSKDKHKRASTNEDNEQHQHSPKSESSKSYDEGTSVDMETGSFTQEIQTTSPSITEEHSVEESDLSVMTGLPGEETPVLDVSLHPEDKRQTETQEMLISKPQGNSNYSKETSTQFNISVNLGEDPCVSCKIPYQSSSIDKQCPEKHKEFDSNGMDAIREHVERAGNPNSRDNAEFSNCDSVSGTEKFTVDCRYDRIESVKLKDIKEANENYQLPMHFDSGGHLKKKVTFENEDNRCKCDLADTDCASSTLRQTIFTNVIFLPDKSKGASPKRYGPKRLGSIYDGMPDDDNENNDDEEEEFKVNQNIEITHDIEKGADVQNSLTNAESKTHSDIVETFVSKQERKGADAFKAISAADRSVKNSTDEDIKANIPDQVNGSLNFVDDHFGLYTGSLAEGISEEFQAPGENKEGNMKPSYGVLGQVIPSPANEVNNNNENKLSENSKPTTFSYACEHHHSLPSQEEIDKQNIKCVENNSSSNILALPTAKTDHEEKPCKKMDKGIRSFDDKINEQEEVEICEICKEPRDLCFCLFSGIKTVMSVRASRTPFSYMRYLKINEKEINWPVLKCAQACFIKGLKSNKTDISEDNRVTFEFDLPTFKGFFGPQQSQSVLKENDNLDGEFEYTKDKGELLMFSIEKKFGIDLSGQKLSSSIDSSRNIMVNDFDECSDDDEVSVKDDGKAYSDESSNNENDTKEDFDSVEESHENKTLFDENKVKVIMPDEKSVSSGRNESSDLENNDYLESNAEHRPEKQAFYSDFNSEFTGSQDSGFNSGRNSGNNGYNQKEDDKSHFEENNAHHRHSDGNHVQTLNSSEGSSFHAALNSQESDWQQNSSYAHDVLDDKLKSDMPEEEIISKTRVTNLYKNEDPPIGSYKGDSDAMNNEEKTDSVKVEDDENNFQCDLAGEGKAKDLPVENVQQKYEDENIEDSFENENFFEHEMESDGNVISGNESDENSDFTDLDRSFAKDIYEESKAHEVDEVVSCSNSDKEDVLSISCPVVDSTGNKISGNITREINSSAGDIKNSIILQEVDFQIENERLLLKPEVPDFPVENNIKDDITNRNRENLLSLHEEDKIATESCENQVEKLNISETSGVQKLGDSGFLSEQADVETGMVEDHEKLKEQLKNFEMTQADISSQQNKSLVDDLNARVNEIDTYTLKCEYNEDMKKHLASVLRRKLTGIDVDNRFVEISSDEEEEAETGVKTQTGYVSNVKEKVKFDKSNVNEREVDEEVIHIPSSDGSGIFTVIRGGRSSSSQDSAGSFSSIENIGSFLSGGRIGSMHSELTIPGNLLSEFLSSDVDFSLPPEELMKQLHEKRGGIGGFLEKMTQKRDGSRQRPVRRRNDRRPRRPENAKSDFASSFYDSFDRNIDFSDLGNQSESASQNMTVTDDSNKSSSNDSDSESMLRRSLERQAAERIVHEYDASSVSSSSVSLQSSRSSTPVPNTDDDSMEVVKLNDIWNPVLEEEKTKCLNSTKIPPTYRCTVLCVDVSASMQGLPWQQVKDFIPEFLTGLEKKKQAEKIEEYVAMVTFGYKTRIVSQPAKNYTQLSKDLNSLRPEGNSPLLPGIGLSLLIQTVRKELGQSHCKLQDIILRHRIILLSDGRPSPLSLVCTSDDIPDLVQQEACQELETSLRDWKLPSKHTHIDCVPVGENPNTDLLESVCKATDGRIVSLSDVQTLVNSTHNHYIAAQVSKQMFQMKTDQLDVHMFKSLVLSLYPSSTPADIAEMVALVEAAHSRVVARQLDSSDSMSTASEDDVHFEPTDLRELPKIGTRVVLGPDVSGRLLSLAPGKGTITGHSRKHRGKVFVQWENGANTLCNCGFKDKFEIFPEDDKDQHKIDNTIKVGFKVRRGPDWRYGNQDGGGDQIGTVYKIKTGGVVCVRWPNGYRHKYRYNRCGVFDVLISDSSDPLGIKMFESEMNKRNNERSNTPVPGMPSLLQLPEANGDVNKQEKSLAETQT